MPMVREVAATMRVRGGVGGGMVVLVVEVVVVVGMVEGEEARAEGAIELWVVLVLGLGFVWALS